MSVTREQREQRGYTTAANLLTSSLERYQDQLYGKTGEIVLQERIGHLPASEGKLGFRVTMSAIPGTNGDHVDLLRTTSTVIITSNSFILVNMAEAVRIESDHRLAGISRVRNVAIMSLDSANIISFDLGGGPVEDLHTRTHVLSGMIGMMRLNNQNS